MSNYSEVLCGEYSCKVTWCRQFLRSYIIQKVLLTVTIWLRASSEVQKCLIMVNIKLITNFDVENIPVRLQNNAYNSWHVIAFIRQLDLELNWMLKKVIQRTMLNSWNFEVESIHVNLYDAGNFKGVMMFTKCFTYVLQVYELHV